MTKTKLSNGQSLIEILIGLIIISTGILILTKNSIISNKNVRFSLDETKINSIAQQKLSEINNYKNNYPKYFWGEQPGGIYYIGLTKEEIYNEIPDQNCCIKIDIKDAKEIIPTTTPNYTQTKFAKITVKIYWNKSINTGKKCQIYEYDSLREFSTYLSNE